MPLLSIGRSSEKEISMKFNISALKKKALESVDFISEKVPLSEDALAAASKHVKNAASATKKELSDAALKVNSTVQSVREHESTKEFLTKTNSLASTAKVEIEKRSRKILNGTKPSNASEPSETETVEGLQNVVDKLKVKDKVGIYGEGLAAVGGAAAGAGVAGSLAGIAGASTIFGSSTLASVLGGVFVTTTPVGWVIGCTALAGAAGYGISKLVRSGSKQDHIRKEVIERLNDRIQNIKFEEKSHEIFVELNQILSIAIMSQLVTEKQGEQMISLIEKGALDPEVALKRIKDMAVSAGLIELS